jgi:hypothetical protein
MTSGSLSMARTVSKRPAIRRENCPSLQPMSQAILPGDRLAASLHELALTAQRRRVVMRSRPVIRPFGFGLLPLHSVHQLAQ